MSNATSGESSIGRRRALARKERNASWLERRDQVLEAAAEAIRAKGYLAMSMSDIASRLGGDRASVYYYFAGKPEIFLGLVERAVQDNVDHVERTAASDESAVRRLSAVVERLAESYERHYPYLHLYVQEDMRKLSESPEHEKLRELAIRYDAAVERITEDGVRNGEFRAELDPQVLKFAVLGALNWMHRWFDPGERLSGADIGRGFIDIFLRGIMSRPEQAD